MDPGFSMALLFRGFFPATRSFGLVRILTSLGSEVSSENFGTCPAISCILKDAGCLGHMFCRKLRMVSTCHVVGIEGLFLPGDGLGQCCPGVIITCNDRLEAFLET